MATTTTTTTTTPITDPTLNDPKVAASTLDFLLIELVPLAHRIAADLHARDTALLSSTLERNATLNTSTSGIPSSSTSTLQAEKDNRQSLKSLDAKSSIDATTTTGPRSTTAGPTTTTTNPDSPTYDDEETLDTQHQDVLFRLDALGYRVGLGLVEKFSQNTPRPSSPLDMIKFICKDLWSLVFRKQIDNLKTNHRGTFVLTDNKYMALSRMSSDRGRGVRGTEEALRKAQPFLYFPCGIIRGALAGFGLNVSVHAETTELPQAVFQIRTVGSKA